MQAFGARRHRRTARRRISLRGRSQSAPNNVAPAEARHPTHEPRHRTHPASWRRRRIARMHRVRIRHRRRRLLIERTRTHRRIRHRANRRISRRRRRSGRRRAGRGSGRRGGVLRLDVLEHLHHLHRRPAHGSPHRRRARLRRGVTRPIRYTEPRSHTTLKLFAEISFSATSAVFTRVFKVRVVGTRRRSNSPAAWPVR